MRIVTIDGRDFLKTRDNDLGVELVDVETGDVQRVTTEVLAKAEKGRRYCPKVMVDAIDLPYRPEGWLSDLRRKRMEDAEKAKKKSKKKKAAKRKSGSGKKKSKIKGIKVKPPPDVLAKLELMPAEMRKMWEEKLGL